MVSTQPGDGFGTTLVPSTESQQRTATNNGAVPALCFEVLLMRLEDLVGFIAIAMDNYRRDVEGKHYSVCGNMMGCAACGAFEGSGRSGKLHACGGCEAVFYCSEWRRGVWEAIICGGWSWDTSVAAYGAVDARVLWQGPAEAAAYTLLASCQGLPQAPACYAVMCR